jgi:hypothetical protein
MLLQLFYFSTSAGKGENDGLELEHLKLPIQNYEEEYE